MLFVYGFYIIKQKQPFDAPRSKYSILQFDHRKKFFDNQVFLNKKNL